MRQRISLFLGSIASNNRAISNGLSEESLLLMPIDFSSSRLYKSWIRFFSLAEIFLFLLLLFQKVV
tara:strand:+ start:63 stop:260 length:198 start_codon:yes stop_codon:yes gene_type:complete